MSTSTAPVEDQTLAQIVAAPPPSTIAGVIAQMESIDTVLANNDGLKWFNRLYLLVTQQVDLNPPGGTWQDPQWLTQLDVVFAGFYFNAIRDFLAGNPIPSSWSALFESRFRTGVDRIQFAVAGMNAHINHDLALALLSTDADLNIVPTPTGPEHADYESVNALLQSLIPATLTMLANDTLGVLAEDTGKVGRILAFWDICRARDLAWDFSNHLRDFPGLVRDAALDAQDAVTGALGRAILATV